MGETASNDTADTSPNSNTNTHTTSLSNSPPPPSAFQQHRNRSNSNNSQNSNDGPNDGSRGNDTESSRPSWRIVILFLIFNFAYVVVGLVFMTPLFPSIQDKELVDDNHIFTNYNLSFTLSDLYILSSLSTIASLIAIYRSYHCDTLHLKAITRFTHIERFHPNNTLKTREEMEEEELEEQCFPNKFMRYICRYAFCSEAFVFIEGILLIIKCLARLNTEIGHFDGDQPYHPIFWISLCVSALYCSFIAFGLEKICIRTSAVGNYKRQHVRRERAVNRTRRRMLLRRRAVRNNDNDDQLESLLEEPLLSSTSTTPNRSNGNLTGQNGDDQNASNNQNDDNSDELVATSDITADAHYKAGWKDLLSICYPDKYYFAAAFIFLIFAAIAQVLIPRYTGNMLDAIATYASGDDDNADDDGHGYIWKVPGFLQNMNKLIIASILGGVFSGARGSIFTIVGARVNVRLRTVLMDSLLAQDIGFFDITKTGDITSRLSSDTTLVGDQVTLNVNVFLRSLVQAIGVLIFMAILSWQLTLVAFISVPAITLLSRWYGDYIRSLTKLMQKKLADGNSISEAALGSMPTVRALGGESTAMKEFEEYMDQYKGLNMRYAVAYLGYATAVTSLPQLVTAVVLFYGGLLVMAEGHDHMTSGQLVSFLLYLSSLSDAFNSIGYIFASLTQAVGAADKVFELINRKPARKSPTTSDDEAQTSNSSGRSQRKLPDPGHHIEQFRKVGVRPTECSGEVTLNKLTMYYPGRPQRRILDDMNLYVPSGAVAALVGPSGGGKSSIISLIQNLYEPRSGDIFIDGIKIRDLSPDWLSKNVAVVSQEPTLFARSIKRNIIYGLEGTYDEPTMEEIKEAARLANAHSFIENLPMKYETDVGERGVQLSGGQKQRIAIARALVRRPKILLLDEATSALDAESEAMVQEAIDKMISNDRSRGGGGEDAPSMTVIIVAHRLSTVQNADIIFVIESGKVVESGSHNELTRNADGAYSNLISRQIKDRGDKEGSAEESSLMESMMVDDSIVTTDDSLSDVVDERSTSSLPQEDKE